jgi:integrase
MIGAEKIEIELRKIFLLNKSWLIESFKFVKKLGFSPSPVENKNLSLLVLFSDLLHVDKSTQGIIKALEGLRDILSTGGEMADFPVDFQDYVLEVFAGFENAVKNYSETNDFNGSVHKENSVIADYLKNTRRSVIGKKSVDFEDNKLRWRRLCVAGYRAVRIAVDHRTLDPDEVTFERAKRSAVAVKYVIKHLPPNGWVTENRLFLDFSDVTDAIRFARVTEKRKKQKKGTETENEIQAKANYETFNTHRRIATVLFQNKPYSWKASAKRKFFGRDINWRTFHESDYDFEPVKVKRTFGLLGDVYTRDEHIEEEEGGVETEFDYPIDTPSRKSSPKGSVEWSLAFEPTELKPMWAKGSLTSEMLGVLLSVLQATTDKNPDRIAPRLILSFVQLQIFYGFHADNLTKLKIISSVSEIAGDKESSLFLLGDRLYIKPKREKSEKGEKDKKAYAAPFADSRREKHLPSNRFFSLPVASFILENLKTRLTEERYQTTPEVFAWVKDGKPQKLSPSKIDAFLRQSIKKFDDSAERIDVAKIARSIRSLRTMEFKRSELLTALLGGEVPRHLASQAHYTNYEQNEIKAENKIIQQMTAARLIESSIDYRTQLGLPNLELPLESLKAAGSPDDAANNIGSPFIVKTKILREFFSALQYQSGNHSDWRVRFNCSTALTAVKLLLYNGLRSVEAKRLNDGRIYERADATAQMAVEAKYNQRFKEWRVVELSPEMNGELQVYRRERDRILKKLNREEGRSTAEINDARGDAFFFFVRQYDLPQPLTADSLRNFLQDAEIFPEGFFGKINFGRHLWRTVAERLEMPGEIIDRQTGHTTRGREPLGVYSLHDWVASNRKTRIIENTLRKTI